MQFILKTIGRISLKLRLTLLFVFIFTSSLGIFSYFLYQERLENRMVEFDANLYNYAIDIAESLDIDSYGVVEFDPGIIKLNEKIFPFTLGKSFISVMDINGKVVAHSQNSKIDSNVKLDERILNRVLKKGVSYINFRNENQKYRIIHYLLPVLKIDSPLILQIIVPYTSVDQSMDKLKNFLAVSLFIILFISGFFGYAFMRRALRPIIEITNKTKQIEVSNLNERVIVPESKDEISELANTINHLFERLRLSFEAQERFVQDASHQLKTPLAIMKGELEIFKSSPKSPGELANYLDSIGVELNSLIKLTNDLLILARVGNEGREYNFTAHQIDEIILGQISRLSKLAHTKNISLNINFDGLQTFDENASSAYVDGDLIGVLFYNFIENAIKYSPEKSTIDIIGNLEGNNLIFEIKDQGPGIKPGLETKIFDRFYRSESVSRLNGSGLGLAICKAVADNHQAEVWAKNNIEGGSSFFFKIKNMQGYENV